MDLGRLAKFIGYSAAGLLAFGALLDAISNAIQLITPGWAAVITAVLLTVSCVAEYVARSRGIPWKLRQGQEIRVRRLGKIWWSTAAGVLILTWIPTVISGPRVGGEAGPAGAKGTVKAETPIHQKAETPINQVDGGAVGRGSGKGAEMPSKFAPSDGGLGLDTGMDFGQTRDAGRDGDGANATPSVIERLGLDPDWLGLLDEPLLVREISLREPISCESLLAGPKSGERQEGEDEDSYRSLTLDIGPVGDASGSCSSRISHIAAVEDYLGYIGGYYFSFHYMGQAFDVFTGRRPTLIGGRSGVHLLGCFGPRHSKKLDTVRVAPRQITCEDEVHLSWTFREQAPDGTYAPKKFLGWDVEPSFHIAAKGADVGVRIGSAQLWVSDIESNFSSACTDFPAFLTLRQPTAPSIMAAVDGGWLDSLPEIVRADCKLDDEGTVLCRFALCQIQQRSVSRLERKLGFTVERTPAGP